MQMIEDCFNYEEFVTYINNFILPVQPPTSSSNEVHKEPANIMAPPPVAMKRYECFETYGKDIFHIVKLLEASVNAPYTPYIMEYMKENKRTRGIALEYEQNTHKFMKSSLEINNKYKPLFIRKLFENHALVQNTTLQDTIRLWIPRFEEKYSADELKCVLAVLKDVEWEWVDEDWTAGRDNKNNIKACG